MLRRTTPVCKKNPSQQQRKSPPKPIGRQPSTGSLYLPKSPNLKLNTSNCAQKKTCLSRNKWPLFSTGAIPDFHLAIRLYFSGCSIILNERSTSRLGQYKCLLCHNWTSLICLTFAFLNQGNCSKGKKYSLPLKNIQKPCSEMLVISGLEVFFPCFNDFTFVFLYFFLQPSKLPL